MTRIVATALTLISLSLTACGGGVTHETLVAESMTAMDELATTLEGVTDKPSWDAAKPALDAVMKDMENIGQKVKSLPKADEATEKKIKDEMRPIMDRLQNRMLNAAIKIGKIQAIAPDVSRFMLDMAKRMKDLK